MRIIRYALTIYSCLFFTGTANSQSNFIKGNYAGGYILNAITVNADSTVTVVGAATDTIYSAPFPSTQQGSIGCLFAKYDMNGNELLRRTYGSLLNDQSGRIIPLNENGTLNYLLIGISQSFCPPPPSNFIQTYIIKVDSVGDTLWTRAGDVGFLAYLDGLVGNDGSYLIAGANGLAATLTKINPIDGDTIWTRWYKQTIAQTIASTSISPADTGFYLSGSVIPPGTNNDHFMLLKTDTDGTLQWGKAYGTNVRPLQCWDMIKLSTGELLMVGQTDVNSQSDVGVVKLNSMGDTVWCHKYSFPFNIYDIGSTAIEDNDGNYVIAGYDGTNGKAQLLKLDTNGNVLWAWKYNWYGTSPMTLKKAYDGGYWLSSGALIKLDSTGYGCTAIPQTIVKRSFPLNIVSISPQMDAGARAWIRPNTQEYINTIPVNDQCVYLGVDDLYQAPVELGVYPNPATSQITLSNAAISKGDLTVTIYDVLGKVKIQDSFMASSDGKLQVDVSVLESGIYFVKVNNSVQRFVKM